MIDDNDLQPISGEKVLYEARPSMSRNQPLWFLLACVLCLIGIGIIILVAWWLQCKGTILTVTNKRTSCRRGILSKSISEVWHQDVRNVQLSQTFWQRVLNVGTIGVSSAAQSGLEIEVKGIPNPDQVKQLIDEHRLRD